MLGTLRKNGNSVVISIPRAELVAAGVDVQILPVDVRPRLRTDLRAILQEEFPRRREELNYLGPV